MRYFISNTKMNATNLTLLRSNNQYNNRNGSFITLSQHKLVFLKKKTNYAGAKFMFDITIQKI